MGISKDTKGALQPTKFFENVWGVWMRLLQLIEILIFCG